MHRCPTEYPGFMLHRQRTLTFHNNHSTFCHGASCVHQCTRVIATIFSPNTVNGQPAQGQHYSSAWAYYGQRFSILQPIRHYWVNDPRSCSRTTSQLQGLSLTECLVGWRVEEHRCFRANYWWVNLIQRQNISVCFHSSLNQVFIKLLVQKKNTTSNDNTPSGLFSAML